ncbi:MAG: hypothetical protein D5R96_06465 [Methanocalculus sp. MSAO_Arc2]|uniref:hypothetical protein n=1 Tax=Methanocalculus sp. MSAO_Arc2 TaxID=2293855 RepID=UPI000FEE9F4F|nr:MAG: hypothetical protein D5R96_06465 [Methanocalculus sp. MSAO_Arc2]
MKSMIMVARREIHILMPPREDGYFSRRLLRDIVRCFLIRLSARSLSQHFEAYDEIWIFIAADLDPGFWKMRIP